MSRDSAKLPKGSPKHDTMISNILRIAILAAIGIGLAYGASQTAPTMDSESGAFFLCFGTFLAEAGIVYIIRLAIIDVRKKIRRS